MHSESHTANKDLLSNEPRVDYSTGKPVLLFECTSSNLLHYSQGVNMVSPQGTGTYEEPAYDEVAPDGYKGSVVRLVGIQGNSGDRFGVGTQVGAPGFVAGGTYTGSIFVRGEKGKYIRFHTKRFGTGVIAQSQPVEHLLNGEWQRIIANPVTLNNVDEPNPGDPANEQLGIMFVNSGSTNVNELLVWGGQIEQLNYATSFIPTYGVPVTRSDDGQFSSNSAINGRAYDLTESWTLFVDFDKWLKDGRLGSSTGIFFRTTGQADGPDSNTDPDDILLSLYGNSQGNGKHSINLYLGIGNSDSTANAYIFDSGTNPTSDNSSPKIAISFDKQSGRLAYYINGNLWEETTNSSFSWGDSNSTYAFIRASLDMSFGINQLSLYNKALNDFECRQITGHTSFDSFESMAEQSNYELYD